jgi:glutamate-1-semialdehyde 2,1-aminomutase
VRPDLLILGKIMGGGMPVAAVAGRRDVLSLGTRASKRVKFEGGTYSAHELSLLATREIVSHLVTNEETIYPRLAAAGDRMREAVARVAVEAGLPVQVLGSSAEDGIRGSLVLVHPAAGDAPRSTCSEELAAAAHPWITERLLKAVLLLEDVSSRSGIGAISTTHTDEDLDRTLDGFRAAVERLKRAGLV